MIGRQCTTWSIGERVPSAPSANNEGAACSENHSVSSGCEVSPVRSTCTLTNPA